MNKKRYTFSELCEALKKSGNEFNPVKGDKVDSENKKNNEKAVKDITGDVKSHIPKMGKKENSNSDANKDYNSITLDYRFDTDPPKSYKDRVKATALGYASVDNMKNSTMDDEGGLFFKGNEEFYKNRKEISKEKEDERYDDKVSGLKTSKRKNKDKYKSKTSYTTEGKTMKRLHFKNTQFLSEAHMLKKVPDCYKTDGNRFLMRDATGTDYIVECKVDKEFNYTKLTVVGQRNKDVINEELNKIKKLYNYRSSDSKTQLLAEEKERESGNMHEMIEKTKKLIKD